MISEMSSEKAPEILFEDEWLLAIDKPAGLVVHPTYKNVTGTLLDVLRARDPNARAALVGLNASHTRAHVIRAMLEGVAFSLRDTLTIFKEINVPVEKIRLGGGGARVAIVGVSGRASTPATRGCVLSPRPESSLRLPVPSAARARAATTSRSSPIRTSRSRTTWDVVTSR